MQLVVDVAYLFMLISVFFYIIYLRNTKKITAGDLIFVMVTILTLADRLWLMAMNTQIFIEQMGDFRSSFSILQYPTNNMDKPNILMLRLKNASVNFENVSFSYTQDNLICGKILVGKKNIDDVISDSLRNNIALIPQDILLFHRSIFKTFVMEG